MGGYRTYRLRGMSSLYVRHPPVFGLVVADYLQKVIETYKATMSQVNTQLFQWDVLAMQITQLYSEPLANNY